jgi:hypothetical protein
MVQAKISPNVIINNGISLYSSGNMYMEVDIGEIQDMALPALIAIIDNIIIGIIVDICSLTINIAGLVLDLHTVDIENRIE